MDIVNKGQLSMSLCGIPDINKTLECIYHFARPIVTHNNVLEDV